MSRLQTVPTPLMLSLALAFAPAAASADDTSLAPVTVSASALALGSDQMSTPASVLASLMDEHGLRQSDLPEIGSQGVVSEVLAGKRQLNLRQVRALAARFSVPMEMLAG